MNQEQRIIIKFSFKNGKTATEIFEMLQIAYRDNCLPKKCRLEISKIKTMLICYHDSKDIIHKEFVPNGTKVNAEYYLGVLRRLISRICLEYQEPDSAPFHRPLSITGFFTSTSSIFT
uniref:FERM domain-containing protein n=1 Tax=Strongyloides stercoralis TaxID=6248 RepID=A0A0K0E213_STRER